MTVLHVVVPGTLDTRTGGYAYDRRIIEGLRARGWEIRVHALDGSFPQPSPGARAHALEALAAIPAGATVLVDGLALGALPEWAEAAARDHRLVALVHHPLALETGLAPERADALRRSEQRALAAAHAIVVTSRATATVLHDYGVADDRVTVIEPGTERVSGLRSRRDGPLSLLCVATLVPRKGHALLLEALAPLADRTWRLTCAGSRTRDPATADALAAQSARLGLAGRVAFVGEVDDAALERLYRSADAFVLATHHEGYGMAFAEALAHGLPIVATAAGAVPDTVPADAALLVPPGDVAALRDALARLLDDAALRQRLSDGARRAGALLPGWDDAVVRMAAVLQRAAVAP